MSWRLVHDVEVDFVETGWHRLQVIAFHPENGHVIFLLHGFDIYRYEIRSNKSEKFSEFLHEYDSLIIPR